MDLSNEATDIHVPDYNFRLTEVEKVPVVLIDPFTVPHYGMFPFYNTYKIPDDKLTLNFERMQPQLSALLSHVRRPAVTILLERSELLNEGDIGGHLTFGEPDIEKCADDWTKYVTCSAGERWSIPAVKSVRIGEDFLDMQDYALKYHEDPDLSNAQNALLTTRNPFIVAPPPVYDTLMTHVEAYVYDALELQEQNRSQPFQVPCNIRDKLPDVVIGVEGRADSVVSLTLSPYDYIRPTRKETVDDYYCTIMIKDERPPGRDAYGWIFGSTLLRPYCLMLDFEARKLAFAPRRKDL
ncbi:hypothetical protein AAVH_34083 [Aphelenchoides avenae]|nr:hypothetical protein AAVH_34083 [Aphelenchus avenae]